ncbi:hypothetical protein [Roseococcus pinisoli]|uniref:Uncharacterized protein n=1 Tax=Roseococcus pinisoli TaxID=2835040 RepID=A0ABS5QG15_9PROT|nr:hypothetical protein [Roseococcus pinisoli]MBS7812318.1 hypothetical protein [Roseococcus pinisoli]
MSGDASLELMQGTTFPVPASADEHLGETPTQEAGPTAVTLTKPKTKKPKALEGEIIPGDAIAKIVKKVETLSQDQVKARLSALPEDDGFLEFEQGGLLKRVLENNWFPEWGFDDFGAYVEATFDFRKRKAYYLIGIYSGVISAGLSADQVKAFGWTKLRILLMPDNPLLTAENVDDWLEKAQSMSKDELAKQIQAQKALGGPSDPTPTDNVKFKLQGDQISTVKSAIEKAMSVSGSESPSAAFEFICLEYLGKPTPPPVAGPVTADGFIETMKTFGWEKTLEAFDKVFPDIGLTVELPS